MAALKKNKSGHYIPDSFFGINISLAVLQDH